MWRTLSSCLLILGVVSTVHASGTTSAYPLDDVPRELPADTRRVRCDREPLERYRGTSIRFLAAIDTHRDFIPYVRRFEEIAREVAIAHFGRAPRFLSHHGSFNCRTIRRSTNVLSEHAFGNALDVRGFDFARARSDEPLPEGLGASYARSFRVRVEQDFNAPADRVNAPNGAFLRALCDRLVREPDLFRVMLGPSFPGHHNHLHLDRAPFSYVLF